MKIMQTIARMIKKVLTDYRQDDTKVLTDYSEGDTKVHMSHCKRPFSFDHQS
jgi:hypothetical protein